MIKAALAVALAVLLSCPRGAEGAEPCDAVFYTPEELPKIHQIDLLMPVETWRDMVDNQANRDYGEVPTTIVFNNRSHAKGRIEVHGGTPQRAGMPPGIPPMDCGGPPGTPAATSNPINTGTDFAARSADGVQG